MCSQTSELNTGRYFRLLLMDFTYIPPVIIGTINPESLIERGQKLGMYIQ